MDVLIQIVGVLVLILLVATLIHFTWMVKAKGDKEAKAQYAKKASLCFLGYLFLNLLRLLLEGI